MTKPVSQSVGSAERSRRVIERRECPECRAAFGEHHGEGCSVRAARLHAGDWKVVCNLDAAIVKLVTVRYVEESRAELAEAQRDRYGAASERICQGDFPMATVTEDMQRIATEALDA